MAVDDKSNSEAPMPLRTVRRLWEEWGGRFTWYLQVYDHHNAAAVLR
jgi:3-methyladenine DNA glycosylase/8-oxoguanine DNA glycosylase